MTVETALHPQLRAMLDKMAHYPPMHTVPLERLRETATVRFAGRVARVDVARIDDIMTPGASGDITIRLYHPEPGQLLPLIVFFHGGNFVMCDLDTYDPLCRRLSATSRCVVASVAYSLAPEHPFPAAPDDCLAATRWLALNARRFGADPTHMALAGDSAGGNLAAVTSIALRDAGQDIVRAQLLIYPMTDAPNPSVASFLENGSGFGLDIESMQRFWPLYYPSRLKSVNPRAAPLRESSLAGLPPAYVITAQYDALRDEGEAYAERLKQAGVPTLLVRYSDMNHGFLFAAGVIDRATDALEACCIWLSKTLGASTTKAILKPDLASDAIRPNLANQYQHDQGDMS